MTEQKGTYVIRKSETKLETLLATKNEASQCHVFIRQQTRFGEVGATQSK